MWEQVSWPQGEPGLGDLTYDDRLSSPCCVTYYLRAATFLLFTPMMPTRVCHFGASPGSYTAPAVSRPEGGWLCSWGCISWSVSQRTDMYTVAFRWGFAEWMGETHLNRGLKVQACSDALIAIVGYFPRLFCVSWERLLRASDDNKQKHISRLRLSTINLLSQNSSTGTSSLVSKPCQGANTWQPFGIIKTGHTNKP